jgi:outer membrane cobalamin receptor
MFVRGFNLDHGSDFATWIEGMPVNIMTHAHGHGYTDLNFLIPELVEHIEYSLGNYYAGIGDFSAAGGAKFQLRRRLDRPIGELGWGADGYQRLLAAASKDVGNNGTLLAGAEVKRNDGPWDVNEELDKFAAALRYSYTGRTHTLSLLGLGYHNSWHASDQIPLRAVESGAIGR